MKSGRFYSRLTDADKKKIVKLYKDGVKRSEIAKSFKVSHGTITRVIRKLSVATNE